MAKRTCLMCKHCEITPSFGVLWCETSFRKTMNGYHSPKEEACEDFKL